MEGGVSQCECIKACGIRHKDIAMRIDRDWPCNRSGCGVDDTQDGTIAVAIAVIGCEDDDAIVGFVRHIDVS